MFSERAPNSVLVVTATSSVVDLLNDVLPSGMFSPIAAVSSCGEAKRTVMGAEYDIVVINTPLPDEFGSDFALDLVQNSSTVVILLVKSEIYEEVTYSVENFGVMTLSKPLSRATLYSAMKIAVATKARLRVLDKEKKSLSSKMDDIRIVNRAKWTLIQKLNMTEDQAHKYIEKQAMDMRMSKRQIAESIIRTYIN